MLLAPPAPWPWTRLFLLLLSCSLLLLLSCHTWSRTLPLTNVHQMLTSPDLEESTGFEGRSFGLEVAGTGGSDQESLGEEDEVDQRVEAPRPVLVVSTWS